MTDRIRVAALAAIVVISSIILVLNVESRKNAPVSGNVEGESATVFDVNKETVTLTLDNQTEQLDYTTEYVPGENAYEMLVRIDAENDGLSFVFEEFSFGKFLKTVNNIEADAERQYWMFKVNDGESSVGVEGYQLHDGDHLSLVLTEVRP